MGQDYKIGLENKTGIDCKIGQQYKMGHDSTTPTRSCPVVSAVSSIRCRFKALQSIYLITENRSSSSIKPGAKRGKRAGSVFCFLLQTHSTQLLVRVGLCVWVFLYVCKYKKAWGCCFKRVGSCYNNRRLMQTCRSVPWKMEPVSELGLGLGCPLSEASLCVVPGG